MDPRAIHIIQPQVEHKHIYVDVVDNRFVGAKKNLPVKTLTNEDAVLSLKDEVVFVSPLDSNIVIDLPPAENNTGKVYYIKKRSGDYEVLLRAVPNELIDEYTEISLSYRNESVSLISDGEIWCIF